MVSRELKDALITRCAMGVHEYATTGIGDTINCENGGELIYVDNGCDVLAVGHLDYVGWTRPYFTRKGRRINAMQLDDRLGVWVILDYLQSLGLKYDILLTDLEEVGQSTAQFFYPKKQYNWMFEFDRTGTDFVAYQYDDSPLIEKYENETATKNGWGSFTDICYLDQLGVAGFNVGVGYHGAHTPQCYADLEDTLRQAHKFATFFEDHKDTKYSYDPNAPKRRRSRLQNYYGRGYFTYGYQSDRDNYEDYDDYYQQLSNRRYDSMPAVDIDECGEIIFGDDTTFSGVLDDDGTPLTTDEYTSKLLLEQKSLACCVCGTTTNCRWYGPEEDNPLCKVCADSWGFDTRG